MSVSYDDVSLLWLTMTYYMVILQYQQFYELVDDTGNKRSMLTITIYPVYLYADEYIVFVIPFVRSFICTFVCPSVALV